MCHKLGLSQTPAQQLGANPLGVLALAARLAEPQVVAPFHHPSPFHQLRCHFLGMQDSLFPDLCTVSSPEHRQCGSGVQSISYSRDSRGTAGPQEGAFCTRRAHAEHESEISGKSKGQAPVSFVKEEQGKSRTPQDSVSPALKGSEQGHGNKLQHWGPALWAEGLSHPNTPARACWPSSFHPGPRAEKTSAPHARHE